MTLRAFLCSVFSAVIGVCHAQDPESDAVLRFDFNDHRIHENNDQVTITATGVNLVDDRFGNERSALYVYGNTHSYVNLGSSDLLKPEQGTISLWVNLQTPIYFGKGYSANPFITMRNGPGDDFVNACFIGYDFLARRINVQNSNDSLRSVSIYAQSILEVNSWYHVVMTFDDRHCAMYLDGRLQANLKKDFRTHYYRGDTVVIGASIGQKNQRYTLAIFDDLRIFHRVLTEEEIRNLYHEPNPNRFRNLLTELLKYGTVFLIFLLVIALIIIRNRRKLKRQKEFYELHHRITELEINAIKSQMNPHFISNSMSAIQSLIFGREYDKASQYIAKLGLLMRRILDYSEKTYTTLEEELGIIRLNLDLEQLRFDNDFSFEISIAPGINIKEVIIPSLITQPFIENAIWHGLLPLTQRPPVLKVRVYEENKIPFISIEDNGVGRGIALKPDMKNSYGIRLAAEKIEGINRLRDNIDFKMKIVDLFDNHNIPLGTSVVIQLLNTFDE